MQGCLADKQIDAFVTSYCGSRCRPSGVPLLTHVGLVAETARELLTAYYQDVGGTFIDGGQQFAIQEIYYAGQLHEVIEGCGAAYDDIVRVANLAIGDMVALLSHDKRLSLPRRKIEFRGRIGDSPAPAQLLILADSRVTLREIETWLIDVTTAPVAQDLEVLAEYLFQDVMALKQLPNFGRIRSCVVECLDKAVQLARQAKAQAKKAKSQTKIKKVLP